MSQAGTIQEEFSDLGIEVTDEDVLAQLTVLASRYNIDSSKISCEFFSFNAKKKRGTDPPTLEVLLAFEAEKLKILKVVTPNSRRPLDPIEGVENLPDCAELGGAGLGTPSRLTKRGVAAAITPDGNLSKKFVTAAGTPVLSTGEESGSQSGPLSQAVGGRYAERTNSGERVVEHGAGRAAAWADCSTRLERTEVEQLAGPAQPFNYMFERLRDCAAALDETICRVGDRLVTSHIEPELGREQLLDLAATTPEPGPVIGRVQCDSDGRLNSNSVVLHGSLDSSGGATVPLDLSQVPSYSLFPGQVVALHASNPNGSKLVASKVYEGVPPPLAPCNLPPGRSISILVAAGPFATTDSSSPEPLKDLLAVIKAEMPSAAILLGPFVDCKNSAVNDADASYDSQWVELVSLMAGELGGLETEVILVPSQRDALGYPVYPQPPFPACSQYSSNMRCVSDPCTLSLAGLRVSLTSTDILLHLGKEEISYPARAGDRMGRLAGHLIQQSNMYPLYPASEEVNLDLERTEQHGLLDLAPHLLLLPSDLAQFVREIEPGTTVINPGRLTRGAGPGTFCFARLGWAANGSLQTQADIIRI